MKQTRFDTEQQVDNFLGIYIDQIRGIEVANGSRLTREIKEEMEETELPDVGRGRLGFMVPRKYYVIKNEDLPILESLFDGLKTAAGADFFMILSAANMNKAWAAAIGVFSTLYKLYKNIKNKGKVLPALEFQILLCLKNHPEGLEIGYLNFLLDRNGIVLREDDLRQILEDLNKIYMNDGSKKELVIREKNLYKASGI